MNLKCPTESIPKELVVDLEGLDIGSSIKISAIELPENVTPTITGRDFVIATVAAPTVVKEPEKPAEETAEGAEAGADGEAPKEGEQQAATDDAKKPEADKDKKEAAPEKK